MLSLPLAFERRGLVLAGDPDGLGAFVVGDPCIVRDEQAGVWRMFLFALPPGHAQALCNGDPTDASAWRLEGPLELINPDAMVEGAFKPFVVLDPELSGRAATIDGRYALLFVTDHRRKVIQRAWADSLGGPWTIEPGVLIPCGTGGDFDAKHVDAVSAYYFRARGEILYFYMGYPERAQPVSSSPFGSAQAAAVEKVGSSRVTKLGPVLRPCEQRGHWASGWVGGLQLIRGRDHAWIGLVNASPTPPDPGDESISREEPPPSLGGFAVCDEEWPVRGWRWLEQPIEAIDELPPRALITGEGVNLWRHHLVELDDGRAALYYNSGDYFKEKLFLKVGGSARRR